MGTRVDRIPWYQWWKAEDGQHRWHLDISPGNQPNQALVTVAPSVCADAI